MILPFGSSVYNPNLTRNHQTGTSYAISDSDRGKVIEFANATSSTIVAATIAQAGTSSQFADGWFCYLHNSGSNAVQVTPTTSTIGGCASMFMPAGSNALIYSDGSNYQVIVDGTTVTNVGAGFWGCGFTQQTIIGATSSSSFIGSSNGVRAQMFSLDQPIPVSKVNLTIGSTSSGGYAYFGIYDQNKNQIFWTRFLTTTSATLSNSVTSILLLTGVYFYAQGADNTAATSAAFAASNFPSATLNKNLVRQGTCANGISSSSMPATLGTISSTDNAVAYVFFEG